MLLRKPCLYLPGTKLASNKCRFLAFSYLEDGLKQCHRSSGVVCTKRAEMAKAEKLSTYVFHAGYLQSLKAGNYSTEEHFVAYFRPRLRSLLRKTGASSDDLEDLQQETFMRVLAAIGSSKAIHPERFGGFVRAVCTNALLEQYRHRKRYAEWDDSVDVVPDRSQDQHALLLTQERKKAVRRIISRLSPRDRRVLCGVFLEHESAAEICRDLGVSRAHLRLLLHRAKRRFVDQMKSGEREQLQMLKQG